MEILVTFKSYEGDIAGSGGKTSHGRLHLVTYYYDGIVLIGRNAKAVKMVGGEVASSKPELDEEDT